MITRFFSIALAFSFVVAAGPVTASAQSFLFGKTPVDAFGSVNDSRSPRYRTEASALLKSGFRPLTGKMGASSPSELRILIKDDSIASDLTRAYVESLANEKSYLMRLYNLSNDDYNRLAAIAFGILGKETKFGTSLKYKLKEQTQTRVRQYKALRAGVRDAFGSGNSTVTANSRGLTQIKDVPALIEHYYCADEDKLQDPRITAVATVGFLAECLKILKNRVKNRELQYVTNENLFDYVLYVYFGSMNQLKNPRLAYPTHLDDAGPSLMETLNEFAVKLARQFAYELGVGPNPRLPQPDTATPAHNMYIQTVRQYMRALAFFENPSAGLTRRTESACRIPGDT